MVHLFPSMEVGLGITDSNLWELTHPPTILVTVITYSMKLKRKVYTC